MAIVSSVTWSSEIGIGPRQEAGRPDRIRTGLVYELRALPTAGVAPHLLHRRSRSTLVPGCGASQMSGMALAGRAAWIKPTFAGS